MFISEKLDMSLLGNGSESQRQEEAEHRIRARSPPYESNQQGQHGNQSAIKAMVAATFAGLKVRMAEVGRSDLKDWLEVIDSDEETRQNRILKHLQQVLIDNNLGTLPSDYPDIDMPGVGGGGGDNRGGGGGRGGGGDGRGGGGGGRRGQGAINASVRAPSPQPATAIGVKQRRPDDA